MGLFSNLIPNSNAPRRELTRRELAVQGVGGLAFGAVVLTLLMLNAVGTFSGAPKVTANLDNVGASVYKGADVKVQGVIVGKVSGFEAREGGAKLELTLEEHQLVGIPKNVVARVLPATVFGTSFVDLVVHGQPSPDRLESGAVVPQDETQETLEFQQALDDIDGLVKALGPADLNIALTSIAQALDGRGEQLGKTIDLADSLLARINGEMPLIRRDLGLLATNMRIVEQNAPELLQAVSDGLVAANTIVDQQAQFTALLTGGLALANDAQSFIDTRGDSLVQAIRQASVVVDATYDNRKAGILDSFRANTLVGTRLPTVIHKRGILLEGGVLGSPPPYYTAADCPVYGSLRGSC